MMNGKEGGWKAKIPPDNEECLDFYCKLTHQLSIKILIKDNQKVTLKNRLSSIEN